ncbi:hypothetical protein CBS101457_001096 [Exobasidium rhododendri]|nr:hypothetical protein CBS101457_001096 [Exobasidium rhododendri]
MTLGKKIAYGRSDRQFIEVYPSMHGSKGTPSPLLIFLHGGAWRSGSTSDHHDLADYISETSDVAVVLIEYRLSLEGNGVYHPDHVSDFYKALDYVFDSTVASTFGYDNAKITLAGHSAGGYMSLAAALASDKGQTSHDGPIRDMPSLSENIRHSIRAFVAVESIFSVVDLVRSYPDYITFVQPAFYPAGVRPGSFDLELEKAGLESWPVDDTSGFNPKIYIIHSHEDTLLNVDYNAQGIRLLQEKGLEPVVDLTSFKVR